MAQSQWEKKQAVLAALNRDLHIVWKGNELHVKPVAVFSKTVRFHIYRYGNDSEVHLDDFELT